MLFTPGRIAFALCFLAVFTIAAVWSYRKDKSERAINYKGSTKIVITILILLALLVSLVKVLKFL
ncbi:MAG: hypothetical protein CMP67_03760 [Flavobacteriales bacterium]|nr:hypothetical protein [Flavobacteriales bacterium]MBO72291.1 hypothetical protein [Flavobacteriales bacterium]|tara:strand:+ start:32 stop:226 length:195 start_codon:yes stop_codon:yes gene_type:complete